VAAEGGKAAVGGGAEMPSQEDARQEATGADTEGPAARSEDAVAAAPVWADLAEGAALAARCRRGSLALGAIGPLAGGPRGHRTALYCVLR
jgi:hypothetical protein